MLKAELIGRIGKDAEIKEISNGCRVINFSVAHSAYNTDARSEEKKEITVWVSCAKFLQSSNEGKIANYLVKGSNVYVRGDISAKTYEKDGEQRVALAMRVSEVELLGGAKKNETEEAAL